MYIVIAILVLGLLVVIHELGHFILAKLNGVRVHEFSIGMGSVKLLSKKIGETEYNIRLLPIGGYVAMHGENEASNDEDSFSSKSPLRRLTIILAGPIMNLLLAIGVFTVVASNEGYATNKINFVADNSPAMQAGIKQGDTIKEINGYKIVTWDDISGSVLMAKGSTLNITLDRGGDNLKYAVDPVMNKESNRYMIGISPEYVKNPGFVSSVKQGWNTGVTMTKQTFVSLKSLFTGKASLKEDVGGPITIVRLSGEAAKSGIWPLLKVMAFISMQLAIFNLLPFPALDGGWTIILLIELISRRKVNPKIVETINYVGFCLLMALMILVIIKDVLFPLKF